MPTKKKDSKGKELEKKEAPMSERFTVAVMKEFGGSIGKIKLTPYQKRLAQHLFIKIDTQLNELEKKRKDNSKPVIAWVNVNMTKLAIDAVHRVELGLDALIPNHISPIPYLNGRTKKYDLDLRIGYVGKDLYRRQMAIDPPADIIYELIYSTDVFTPIKKSVKHQIEAYDFEITNAFDRGEVIGGFAYIQYEDKNKNRLVLVSEADFIKSKNKAQSKEFWDGHPEPMRYKSLVNRATGTLQVDPKKVNASFMFVENDDNTDAMITQSEIDGNANNENTINAEVTEIDEGIKGGKAAAGQEAPEAGTEAKGPGGADLYDKEKCGPCPHLKLKDAWCPNLDDPEKIEKCQGAKSKKAPF